MSNNQNNQNFTELYNLYPEIQGYKDQIENNENIENPEDPEEDDSDEEFQQEAYDPYGQLESDDSIPETTTNWEMQKSNAKTYKDFKFKDIKFEQDSSEYYDYIDTLWKFKNGFLTFDKKVDIVITYSWGDIPHGICGHVFEAYELWRTIKEHQKLYTETYLADGTKSNFQGFQIKVLFADGTDRKTIMEAILNKYDGSEKHIKDMEKDFIFIPRPKVLKLRRAQGEIDPLTYLQSSVVFCDGRIPKGTLVNSDLVHIQTCGKGQGQLFDEDVFNSLKQTVRNFCIYSDSRLKMEPFIGDDQIFYYDDIKRLRFDSLRTKNNQIDEAKEHSASIKGNTFTKRDMDRTYMVYITPNCRSITGIQSGDQREYQKIELSTLEILTPEFISNAMEIFDIVPNKCNLLILGVPDNQRRVEEAMYKVLSEWNHQNSWNGSIKEINFSLITNESLPIKGLFGRFQYYIYTPTPKKWDCSSRLIPECYWYGKEVIFTETAKKEIIQDQDIINRGLFWRIYDTLIDGKTWSLYDKKLVAEVDTSTQIDIPKGKLTRNLMNIWVQPENKDNIKWYLKESSDKNTEIVQIINKVKSFGLV